MNGASVDALKRLDSSHVDNTLAGTAGIAAMENLRSISSTMGGNYAEMLLELSKNGPNGLAAAQNINRFVYNLGIAHSNSNASLGAAASPSDIANANNLQRIATNDQRIRHLR